MDIRPITNDADHAEAIRSIEDLLGAKPGTDAFHKLDAISTLVEAYERKRWPLDGSFDPIDLIKYTIAEVGRTRAELVEIVGSPSRVSEILAKRRALTLDMMRAISAAWGIPLELLAAPYELDGPPRPTHQTKRARPKAAAQS